MSDDGLALSNLKRAALSAQLGFDHDWQVTRPALEAIRSSSEWPAIALDVRMRILRALGDGPTAASTAAERIVEKLSEWGEPWPPTAEDFAASSALGGVRWIRQCLKDAGMNWKAATAAAGARRTANRK